MKVLLLLCTLYSLSVARENPFQAPFTPKKTSSESIPILNISTHDVYKKPEKKQNQRKHISIDEKKQKYISIAKTTTVTKATKPTVSAPIMIPTLVSTPIVIKRTIPIKPKPKVSKRTYTTLYKNYFLTLKGDGSYIKIISKDVLISKKYYTSPRRYVLDFDKLQYFHTKTLNTNKTCVKQLTLGSHHNFYRMTLTLKQGQKVKVRKTSYGYLLSFF